MRRFARYLLFGVGFYAGYNRGTTVGDRNVWERINRTMSGEIAKHLQNN